MKRLVQFMWGRRIISCVLALVFLGGAGGGFALHDVCYDPVINKVTITLSPVDPSDGPYVGGVEGEWRDFDPITYYYRAWGFDEPRMSATLLREGHEKIYGDFPFTNYYEVGDRLWVSRTKVYRDYMSFGTTKFRVDCVVYEYYLDRCGEICEPSDGWVKVWSTSPPNFPDCPSE